MIKHFSTDEAVKRFMKPKKPTKWPRLNAAIDYFCILIVVLIGAVLLYGASIYLLTLKRESNHVSNSELSSRPN